MALIIKKANLYFYISLAFAIWFLLTCAIWMYLASLVISLPAGIVSFVLMQKARTIEGRTKRIRLIEGILIAAVVISLAVLVGLVVTN